MTTQPEALRLADLLESCPLTVGDAQQAVAAAELRRLHGLDFALRNCEQALKNMATKYMDTVDQRDALLEALKGMRYKYGEYACSVCDQADAAIKAVEDTK